MGLFSRLRPSDTARRARASVSSEAQARELRVRARRRLIGALALVLAVVIVLPMLLETDTGPSHLRESPIVVPTVVMPALAVSTPGLPAGAGVAEGRVVDAPQADQVPQANQAVQAENRVAQAPPPTATPATPGRAQVAAPPQRSSAATSTPARARATPTPATQERTDDGSLALALLEGRAPPPGAASNRSAEELVLQIAAYATQQDAQAQRDKLMQSGITNAYVEALQANGKNTYRVRVGPFVTREAAQAAQTRLRTLGGYQDAFITQK